MDGRAACSPVHDTPAACLPQTCRPDHHAFSLPSASHDRRRELKLIVVLLLVAVGVRAWLISRTEVAARDSIGYIRYAWQLRHRPWNDVVRNAEQHPGYPFAILAASGLVRPCVSGPECSTMQLSAQLANSVAGVLLVIPMFYLGRELFDRTVGFWAALLFQTMPASGRVLSDGLSEGLFLLFAAAALWAAARALRTGSPAGFLLAGLFGGLGYLTRPEGALLVAATGLVLAGMQAVAAWRRPWRRVLACAAALGLTAAAVASPFVAVTQRFTTKPTAHRILETAAVSDTPAARSSSPGHAGLPASALAVWWQSPAEGGTDRVCWGLWALALELVKATQYVGWLPGLVGLWWFRDQLRQAPGAWVVLVVFLVLAAVLWRVAIVVGYLSDRHTLLVILCSVYSIAAGSLLLCRLLITQLARSLPPAPARLLTRGSLGAGLLLLALVAVVLPKTLETLHGNRRGFRAAGLWLAEHAAPTDPVIDPYFWSHYYSGRVFSEGADPPLPPGHRPVRYVVLERAGLEHVRLPLLPEAERLKERGHVVFRWAGPRQRTQAEVFIYAVPCE